MVKKKGIFERLEAEVINGAEEYVVQKVKKKILRIGEISLFALLGFILMSIGLAYLIAAYISILNNGLSFIVLGLTFMIVSMFLAK